MGKLTIPPRHLPGLRALLGLGAPAVEEIASSLTAEPEHRSTGLASRLQRMGLARADSEGAAAALFSLFHVQHVMGFTPRELVDDLMEALEEQTKTAPPTELSGPLIRLLSIPAMSLQAKASILLMFDERNYCQARIVSDLRPVFGGDPSAKPAGFGLVHLLQIEFHDASGDLQSIQVALSTSDLADLEKVIQGARANANLLEEQVKATRATLFDFPED